ncbi:periodic tryptophan protein 1 homolog [Lineus longissimus]|uniref:periodic tryptophan protein 1 homolog n=1 Tax=Lineus longissimus TaxID=88925 RepID=UPI002B4C7F55
MNYVPCVAWVRKGIAKPVPDKVELSPEELKALIESTKEELGDLSLNEEIDSDSSCISDREEQADADAASAETEKQDGKKGRKRKKKKLKEEMKIEKSEDDEDDDVMKEYNMDDYDKDDEEGTSFDGIGGLTYYSSNTEDPYITFKEEGDSDDEEFKIGPQDNLLVCGRVKKDHSNMDVFIYNENDDDFFIHHDLLLPAFPLAMEWLDFDPGDENPGNMVAVSSMEPTIGIWDLDIEDAVEPVVVLGEKPKKKKTKKKKSESDGHGHTDAVLDLSWNKNVRNVLASCSADGTVALWDLTQGKVVKSIAHDEKVQSIDWHPFEAQTLVSGSFDKTVRLFDCRSSDKDCKKWTIAGEVERVVWNWSSPFHLLASSDQGFVYLLDVRTDKTVFTLSAHTGAVTGLCLSSQVPNLLVTGSADKLVKVWDIQDNKPEMVMEKNFKLGGIQCISCCPDAPYAFAAGCEKDVKVWDIRENKAVTEHFKKRAAVGAKCDATKTETDSASAVEAMDSLSVKDDNSETKAGNSKPNSASSSYQSKKKKNKKKKLKSGKW